MDMKEYKEWILKAEVNTWPHKDRWILEEDRALGYSVYSLRELYGIQTGYKWYTKPDLNIYVRYKRDNNIRWITNPLESPDMSPIENI